MDCDAVCRGSVAERYARCELREPEKSAYEEHFFRCARCRAELEGCHAILAAMRDAGFEFDPGWVVRAG